jgi:hypothetical protein
MNNYFDQKNRDNDYFTNPTATSSSTQENNKNLNFDNDLDIKYESIKEFKAYSKVIGYVAKQNY